MSQLGFCGSGYHASAACIARRSSTGLSRRRALPRSAVPRRRLPLFSASALPPVEQKQTTGTSVIPAGEQQAATRRRVEYPPGRWPLALELHYIVNHPVAELTSAALVIGQCAVFALQTVGFTGVVDALLFGYSRAVSTLFVVEYFTRWYAVGLRPGFLLTRSMLIDFFAVIFPLGLALPINSNQDQTAGLFVRCLRFARVFQLQKVMDDEGMEKLFGDIPQSRRRFATVVLTVCTLLYVSGGLFYDFEKEVNPAATNMFTSLYWAVNTLFTVGPGDVVPITTPGRIVSTATVLIGAVLIPLQLSEIVAAAMQARGEALGISDAAGKDGEKKKGEQLNVDPLAFAAESLPPPVSTPAVSAPPPPSPPEPQVGLAAKTLSAQFDEDVECPRCHLRVHQTDARFCRNCAALLRKKMFD